VSAPGKGWPSYEVTAYYGDNTVAHRATIASVPSADLALAFAEARRSTIAALAGARLLVTCKRIEVPL